MPKGAVNLSNDGDFVKATKYSKKAGVLPNLPRDPPPDWQPLRINNPYTFGEAKIPEGIAGDPISLFDLFFNAAEFDKIAYHTNQHAAKLRDDQPDDVVQRGWKPTSATELYTYFVIVVYMGVHREPSVEEYWQRGHANAPRHLINQHMSKTRWEQLDR